MKHNISDKKQKLYDAMNQKPLEVGDSIAVQRSAVTSYQSKSDIGKYEWCIITDLSNGIQVQIKDSTNKDLYIITEVDIAARDLYYVGANPFSNDIDHIRLSAYQLESILSMMNLCRDNRPNDEYKFDGVVATELNWNPYVYDKDGNKLRYQRDFVWSLEDKQNLVESIYQNIDCGKIVIRLRGWNELVAMRKAGETELSFRDVVDGKQRLDAVRGFIENEYPDMHGNYYSDLSNAAQRAFTKHQLFSYAEMPEDTKDENVLNQFLKLNFCGVPQSREHIEFVRNLQTKI